MTNKDIKKKKLPKVSGLAIAAIVFAVLALSATVILLMNKWELAMKLNGADIMHLEYGTSYKEEGATCVYTGTWLPFIRDEVEVTETGSVDDTKTGTYTLTYTADYKNEHAEMIRTVIIEDTQPPRIVLESDPDSYTPYNHEYEEEGFKAEDNYDGDLSEKVKAEEKDGKVYYTVSDSSGNTASVVRTINYDDRKGPVITLSGGDSVTVYVGDKFSHEWFAEDDVDGDLSEDVKITSDVDTSKPGEYTVTYTISDSHGNESVATKTVTVKEKPKNSDPPAGEGATTVYLTFDDGPSQYTEQLLGILDQYNVKATFFTTSAYPGYAYCMAKEAAAGHTVAVHTATHDYAYVYSSEDAYWADFNRQNAVIAEQTGIYSTMFRFPGGSSNTVSRSYNSGIMSRLTQQAANYGYQYFDWNVSSGDAGETTDTSVVYSNVVNGIAACARAGVPAVVLQHDTKGYSVAAVASIIEWGLENGYTFAALTPGSYALHHGVNN